MFGAYGALRQLFPLEMCRGSVEKIAVFVPRAMWFEGSRQTADEAFHTADIKSATWSALRIATAHPFQVAMVRCEPGHITDHSPLPVTLRLSHHCTSQGAKTKTHQNTVFEASPRQLLHLKGVVVLSKRSLPLYHEQRASKDYGQRQGRLLA